MANTFSSLVDTFKNTGVSKVYGTSVEMDGQEVIPVALVSFVFGGGSEGEAGASGGEAGAWCCRWASTGTSVAMWTSAQTR